MVHVPEKFREHTILLVVAHQYNQINEQTHPDMAERIAAKEKLVHDMARLIERRHIPLVLAFVAPGNGLKAAFLRAIGERGDPGLILKAVEHIASETEPFIGDLNLKWQIIRAYRNLYVRHPGDHSVAESAQNAIPSLLNGADAALAAGVEDMKKKLGIA